MAKKADSVAVREATDSFEKTCGEWLNVITISTTSEARTAISAIAQSLDEFIGAAVRDIPAGKLRPFEGFLHSEWQELRDAAQAITLDEGHWDDEMLNPAARTLLKAAEIGRSKEEALHAELAARRAGEENAAATETQH